MIKYNGFKSWKEYIENTLTDSINNLAPLYFGIGYEVAKLRKLSNESLIEFHKKIFGKQNFTYIGEERLYVWIFDKFVLFVGKNKGVVIELFLSHASKDNALEVYNFYINSVGITKELDELHIDNYKYTE